MTVDMKEYGLSDRLAALAALSFGLFPARIVSQSRGLYRAVCESGELAAEISGKLRFDARTASDLPAVGDFVLLDRAADNAGNALIQQLLPRSSAFTRKAAGTSNDEQVVAANIDTVFICMSLNNDFNLRRLERYLAIGWNSGAIPVAVLTKADLCPNVDEMRRNAQSVCMGADVLVTSAMEHDGYESIRGYISRGKTIALTGSSGVGKSTLINRLLGFDMLDTNGLRNDDKGRHTTTRRELILLPDGGMVIDTPGMRELGMWDSSGGVDMAFADIEALAATCRFADCTHENEPGCAVRRAIARGELGCERLASYRKLRQETQYAQDKQSYLAEKEKWAKNIALINKASKKG